MCGIAGILRLDGAPVDVDALDRVTDALAHRGPDGRGTCIRGAVGLGHRRLSIVDLSDAGKQPMLSSDGTIALTFNGEIYNFLELRAQLESRGRQFRSRCDTEVLLALYEEEGPACVQRLRGMFAFAIHDTRRNILFLARDRVGKKPLKYFHHNHTFAFASELKALRMLRDCPREIDTTAVHHFLTMMYLPSPSTGFVGIHTLPAAHTLTVDIATGKETLERYWELSYVPDEAPSVEEWQDRIRTTFTDSVRMRMVADVPVGAFLSGGVDSGAVVAAMSTLSTQPVKTFSIGSRSAKHNELPQAEEVARRYGTDHHSIVLEPDIVTLLPELVHYYEEPYADPSSIPTYLVARETRKEVTVALNGDGGDENFAGYVRYPILTFSERWARAPRFVHQAARAAITTLHRIHPTTFSYRASRFEQSIHLPWEQRYLQYLSFFTEEEKQNIYKDGVQFEATASWYAQRTEHARSRASNIVHQAMSMDMDTYLADDLLPKVDVGTMAHGLEARSPFLDHTLLELSAQIPVRHLLHGRVGKWILKDMLKDELPADILWAKKRGFRLPLDAWFRGNLRSFVREKIFHAPPVFWTMFDRPKIERFLNYYDESHVDLSDHVWSLMWLSEWMEQYT